MKKLITLSLLFAAFNSYAQKVNLTLDLKKDSIYNLTIKATMNTLQVIQGKEVAVRVAVMGTTKHKVVGIKDTVYDLETSYRSLAINTEISGQQINMNTDDTTSVFGKIMHLTIGKPFHIWMSKSGFIVNVQGFDEIFANAVNSFSTISEERRNLIIAQLKGSLGENSLRSNMQQSFIIYPKHAVALKGTWKNVINKEQSGVAASYNTTYILTDVSDDALDIEGKVSITSQAAVGFRPSGGYWVHLNDLKGQGYCKLRIDRNTGWVLASVIQQNLSANVEMKKTATGPVEMTFPMAITATCTATDK